MRVYEITKPKQKIVAKVAPKRKSFVKGPYAPPPKALPKPKPQIPTPLEVKRNQEQMQQAYANSVLKSFEKKSSHSSRAENPPRSQQEMETFIKIVRGEIPRKPQ